MKRNRFIVLSVLLVAALVLVLAGCAEGETRVRRRPEDPEGRLRVRRPDRRPRLHQRPRRGPALRREAAALAEDRLRRERARGRRGPVHRPAHPGGEVRRGLHVQLRLHGRHGEGRREVPEQALHALLGLQAERERRHLLRRPLPDVLPERPDGRRPHEVEQDRLRRRVPHPRGRAPHRRLRPRREGDEPEGEGRGALDLLLVRPPEGQGGRRGARGRRRRLPGVHRGHAERGAGRRGAHQGRQADLHLQPLQPHAEVRRELLRVGPARGLGRHVREDPRGHQGRQVEQRRHVVAHGRQGRRARRRVRRADQPEVRRRPEGEDREDRRPRRAERLRPGHEALRADEAGPRDLRSASSGRSRTTRAPCGSPRGRWRPRSTCSAPTSSGTPTNVVGDVPSS